MIKNTIKKGSAKSGMTLRPSKNGAGNKGHSATSQESLSTFQKELEKIPHYSLSKTEVYSAQSIAFEAFEKGLIFTIRGNNDVAKGVRKLVSDLAQKQFGTGG